jgi:hypothetical protein
MQAIKPLLALAMLSITSVAAAQLPASLMNAATMVQETDRISESVDSSVWPGFSFSGTDLFVWDKETRTGMLFHVSPLPAGFAPMDAAHATIGIGAVPQGASLVAGPNPIAGRLAAWISGDQMPWDKGTPVVAQEFYSGAFKVFEAYRGFAQATPPQGASYPMLDAEADALLRAEGRVLAKALSSDKTQIPSLISAFLSLRAQRLARLQSGLRDYEWTKEMADGLAAYAGYQVRFKLDPQGARADLFKELQNLAKDEVGAEGPRFGTTGCALALVLDQVAPQWKVEFEKGARNSLQPILEKAAGQSAPADLAFVDLDGLRREQQAVVAGVRAEQQAKLDAILKADGLVLVLNLDSVLSKPDIKWSNRYVPNGVMKLDGSREIRTNYYNLTGPGVLDFASSRPILIETRKSITAGFGADEKPYMTLNGKPLNLDPGQVVDGDFELRGNHLTLRVNDAHLSYLPKTLTVEPRVADASSPSS